MELKESSPSQFGILNRPIPAPVVLVIIAAAIAVLWLYAASRQRSPDQARAIKCTAYLKQIALALALYADDNEGWLPPESEWHQLLQPYVLDQGVFRCPGAPDAPDAPDGYSYLGGGKRWDERFGAEKIPLVTDRPDREHARRLNILFADGHVESLSPGEYHSRLQ